MSPITAHTGDPGDEFASQDWPSGGCGHGSRGFARHHHSAAHGHGRGPFGHFGRARRGLIRAATLAALAEKPMHGYEIMQRLETMSGGMWRPSPGSVYPTLQEFEDRGLVRSEEVEGKRVYSLTEAGRAEADKLPDGAGDLPWMKAEGPPGTRMKLRQAIGQLAAAARQVGAGGSDEMVDQTLAILAEARKRIYQLLAEGD